MTSEPCIECVIVNGYKIEFNDKFQTYIDNLPEGKNEDPYQWFNDFPFDDCPHHLIGVSRSYESLEATDYGFYLASSYAVLPINGTMNETQKYNLSLITGPYPVEEVSTSVIKYFKKLGGDVSSHNIYFDYCDMDRAVLKYLPDNDNNDEE